VANGVKMGRKPKLSHHQQLEAIKRLSAGKETQGEIARSYNVSRWALAFIVAGRARASSWCCACTAQRSFFYKT
jgi:Helix-turn-helix domain of resolvase